MPSIISVNRTLADIAPNNIAPNDFDINYPSAHGEWFLNTTQHEWFLHIRYHRCPKVDGSIRPPDSRNFMRAWNIMSQELNLEFGFCGSTLEECKQSLQCDNHLPRLNLFLGVEDENDIMSEDEIAWNVRKQYNRKIAAAWAMMIVVFNMYAEILKEFRIIPFNRIDFIGSAGNDNNYWQPYFNNRCVLFITNNTLRILIELFKQRRTVEFFSLIFEIYDNLHINLTIHNSVHNINRTSLRDAPAPHTSQVPSVDAPTHNIAQEYLNRIDEDETAIVIDNRQIANMVMRTESPLPRKLSKTIYDICMALYISHPV